MLRKVLLLGVTLLASGQMSFAQQKPLTTNTGAPVGNNQSSKTAGENGPVLLEDVHLIEKLASFDRERIPERVVHARGAGAYGEFESYGDFSKYTKASLFNTKGKTTPLFVRFSTVVHEQGSPETLRDPRGFAVKFYTDQGNYDLVGNNLPVFFIRDAMKFPDMVHSFKPSPMYNKQDQNRVFDFLSHQPEATNMLTYLYTDLGTPANHRQIDGFGVHAFKWVNAQGEVTYVKYKWTTLQGVKSLTAAEASQVQGKNHSHATSDLYEQINKGNFPSWELSVQMIKPEDLDKFDFNPLDPTKIWPESVAPSMKIGKMTLNRIPGNFFEEVEQAAFSPGTLVPGIEPSEDKLLQGRVFSYFDTQRYRLGANFQRIAVNAPKVEVNSNNQNGLHSDRGKNSNINYEPSVTRQGTYTDNKQYEYATRKIDAETMQRVISKENNFAQAGELYRSLSESDKKHLISNLAGDLGQVSNKEIVNKMVSYFYQADADYGNRLIKALKLNKAEVTGLVAQN
ncbi:catalase [Pontibacter diazotrophicus]|uniref:Catalase n=1 Tax=Pontibacter diazotrophicus TaxID=1400979 RepID=A0A3D8LIE8_9BACT|nr:catalase [Pontibacter diazotrophicus]RDV17223.1 catalase [Pontibacter diazotrophicus]